MTEPTDDILRRWLLHKLPPADAEALEQRVLTDEAFGERLRDVETDLLDDYARGTLGAGDRDAAARRFASSARGRLRVRIARSLARLTRPSPGRSGTVLAHEQAHSLAVARRHADRGRRTRRALAIGALASACVLAIALIGWNRRFTMPAPVRYGQATITLLADSQRGTALKQVASTPAGATVRLQAEVDDPNALYTLEIDDDGRTVFRAEDLAARTVGPYRFVEVVFDSRQLAAGSHRVRVAVQGAPAPEATWTLETLSE
jgi:hypothetical protein